MSTITLYQCDMCHKRSENLYTIKVKVPVIDFEDDESKEAYLERGGGPRVEYTTYDLCEDCVRNLKKFIDNFHKTIEKKDKIEDSEPPENDAIVWFVEYKPDCKKPWTRESGPFTDKKSAELSLDKFTKLNQFYLHRISARVVPPWVLDFINCNDVKEK